MEWGGGNRLKCSLSSRNGNYPTRIPLPASAATGPTTGPHSDAGMTWSILSMLEHLAATRCSAPRAFWNRTPW